MFNARGGHEFPDHVSGLGLRRVDPGLTDPGLVMIVDGPPGFDAHEPDPPSPPRDGGSPVPRLDRLAAHPGQVDGCAVFHPAIIPPSRSQAIRFSNIRTIQLEEPMQYEPVWTVAGLTALASAIIGVVVAFGVPLPDGAAEKILVLVAAIAPTIVPLIARAKVTPNAKLPTPPAE